jgi:hypothetical protein
VDDHLRTCDACRADFKESAAVWDMLGTIPAEGPDSSAMRDRFAAMLAGYVEASTAHRRVRLPPDAWPASVRYVAGLAAAAALLFIGFATGRQAARPSEPDPEIAVLRGEVRDMREMVTLSLLQQQSASERLKGVTWTSRIDAPGDELTLALLDALMHDPNDNVRLATVDALRRFADRDAVRRGAIEALSRQRSPLVQVALIDFVIDFRGGSEAADALRRLSNDPAVNEAVRARATQGLQRLG